MKIRWLVLILAVIIVISYFSQGFLVLNPRTGAWTAAGNANYTSGTINVPGFQDPVNVTIDASGLAHISATNNHDLLFAQGYYSASNRLFQMEMQALLASGNLSKYVGSQALSSVQAMRLIGLPYNAWTLEQNYKDNYPQYYQYLKDYSDGVNAYINSSHSPQFEFKLLGIKPFQWSVLDTLVWEEYMSWSLTTGAAEPLQSDLFYNALGFDNTTTIWPYYPYFTENITVVPGSGTVNGYNLTDQNISESYLWTQNWFWQWATGVNTTLLKQIDPLIRDALANISDPLGLPGAHGLGTYVGSNSWVVTSNYSQSNYPIMANDPHLNLLAPSVWIPLQLSDPSMNVTGWDLAGIPGILIGHTPKTSWGLTTPEGNSANDYLEILNGTSYMYNGTWKPMTVYNYTLLGKNYSIYYTNNGPLIARNSGYGISMNWEARSPSYALISELKLDESSNYTDMVNALKYWQTPPQNFAMTSDHHAGILTAGEYSLIHETLPNSKNVSVVGSRSLLNGSNPAYEPAGIVPFDYLPQAMDPARGYMFAPNQPTAGMDYPYPFIGGFWASGGRAETIYHFLKSNPNMTINKMMALQSNVSDYWASQLTPLLIKALNGMSMNQSQQTAFSYLDNWNFTTYQDQIGITVYWYLISEIYNISFDKIYSENGVGGLPSPSVSVLIQLAESNPKSIWLNGNFTNLVREAFSLEIPFLTAKLGGIGNWTWGNVHLLEISSLTGLSALSIGPIPIWGDSHTVSVGGIPKALEVPEPYVTVGSSLRTVASPGSKQFYGVFPGGPNENVLSYYFSLQLSHWENHQYYNMNDQKAEVNIRYE